MIYPAAQKPEPAIHVKSIDIRAADRLRDFARQFWCDPFVGVNDQHPFMLPGNILQGPVLLSWGFSIPNELHDSDPSSLGNRLRAICARRIDDDDFLREGNARKTIMQFHGFFL